MGAVTYGRTDGEAEIVGSLVELVACEMAKMMATDTAAQKLVIVAMEVEDFSPKNKNQGR